MMKYWIISALIIGIFIPCLNAEQNFDDLYAQKREVLEKIFSRLTGKIDEEKVSEFFNALNCRIVSEKDSALLNLYFLSDKILDFVNDKIAAEKKDFISDEFDCHRVYLAGNIERNNITEFNSIINAFYYGGEIDLNDIAAAKASFMNAAQKFSSTYKDVSKNVSLNAHERMTLFYNSLFLSQNGSTVVLQYNSFAGGHGINGMITFKKKQFDSNAIWLPVAEETSSKFFMTCH